jgi:DNA-directed RNA polymerase I subunit RPA2
VGGTKIDSITMAISLDPLHPSGPSSSKHTFKTLERERMNRHPSETGMDHPALEEIVKPHIASFDALTDMNGDGTGLLQLGIQNILPKVVFDGKKREDAAPGSSASFGNKITCQLSSRFGAKWTRN